MLHHHVCCAVRQFGVIVVGVAEIDHRRPIQGQPEEPINHLPRPVAAHGRLKIFGPIFGHFFYCTPTWPIFQPYTVTPVCNEKLSIRLVGRGTCTWLGEDLGVIISKDSHKSVPRNRVDETLRRLPGLLWFQEHVIVRPTTSEEGKKNNLIEGGQ